MPEFCAPRHKLRGMLGTLAVRLIILVLDFSGMQQR